MGMRLILIWGVLIGIYILVSNSPGTTAGLGSLQKLVTGVTGTLQGRGSLNNQG